MGLLSKLVKTGLAVGAGITAYQATQKAKQENGTVDADSFIRRLKLDEIITVPKYETEEE